MVSTSTSITAAAARTLAPITPAAPPAPSRGVPAGKGASQSGETLPPEGARADVADIVRKLNELMAQRERNLRFHVDQASGRTVITVRDAATDAVVRQIPAEEVLVMARALERTGALLDARG